MANLSYGTQGSSYYDLARKGQIYTATAIITAAVGYGTAAGTGGPLLWNGTGGTVAGVNQAAVNAVIIGLSYAITTAETTTSIAMGLTGGGGQAAAPTATTAIDGITNNRIVTANNAANGAGNACNVYRVGTVSAAGKWFQPLWFVPVVAVTSLQLQPTDIDLAGQYIVPPGSWISVAAHATGTAGVIYCSMTWAEIPSL